MQRLKMNTLPAVCGLKVYGFTPKLRLELKFFISFNLYSQTTLPGQELAPSHLRVASGS